MAEFHAITPTNDVSSNANAPTSRLNWADEMEKLDDDTSKHFMASAFDRLRFLCSTFVSRLSATVRLCLRQISVADGAQGRSSARHRLGDAAQKAAIHRSSQQCELRGRRGKNQSLFQRFDSKAQTFEKIRFWSRISCDLIRH